MMRRTWQRRAWLASCCFRFQLMSGLRESPGMIMVMRRMEDYDDEDYEDYDDDKMIIKIKTNLEGERWSMTRPLSLDDPVLGGDPA